jgi:hypothetical protein
MSRPPIRGPLHAPSKTERVDGPFAQAPAQRPQGGAGGAAGRGLAGKGLDARGGDGPELVPRPPPPDPRGRNVPAPFAGYGPDARAMAGQVDGSRSQSMGVLAIVGGLAFMTVSVIIVALVVLLVSFFLFQVTRDDTLAGGDADKQRQIRDTGSAEPIRSGGGGGGPRGPGDPGDRTVGDPNAGPPPGPATVTVPTNMMFLSIEVNCPGGYRARGNFKRISQDAMSATVKDVPGDESCIVTFQGSEPAKANISGNQRKICKFNPTECYLQ